MKKLLTIGIIAGAIGAVAKMMAGKKAEWEGLTESQVRERLATKLPNRMPEDKRAMVADKVVGKMRERGALAEEEEVVASTTTGDVDASTDSPDEDTDEQSNESA